MASQPYFPAIQTLGFFRSSRGRVIPPKARRRFANLSQERSSE